MAGARRLSLAGGVLDRLDERAARRALETALQTWCRATCTPLPVGDVVTGQLAGLREAAGEARTAALLAPSRVKRHWSERE